MRFRIDSAMFVVGGLRNSVGGFFAFYMIDSGAIAIAFHGNSESFQFESNFLLALCVVGSFAYYSPVTRKCGFEIVLSPDFLLEFTPEDKCEYE